MIVKQLYTQVFIIINQEVEQLMEQSSYPLVKWSWTKCFIFDEILGQHVENRCSDALTNYARRQIK